MLPSVDFDGRPDWEELEIPGLWLFGEEDRIIPARSSTTILQGLVESGGKPFTDIVYPGGGTASMSTIGPTCSPGSIKRYGEQHAAPERLPRP